jgi:hypothetical protein
VGGWNRRGRAGVAAHRESPGLRETLSVDDVRLTDITQLEAWDAAKRSRPELTWEEFENAWTRFLREMTCRKAKALLH